VLSGLTGSKVRPPHELCVIPALLGSCGTLRSIRNVECTTQPRSQPRHPANDLQSGTGRQLSTAAHISRRPHHLGSGVAGVHPERVSGRAAARLRNNESALHHTAATATFVALRCCHVIYRSPSEAGRPGSLARSSTRGRWRSRWRRTAHSCRSTPSSCTSSTSQTTSFSSRAHRWTPHTASPACFLGASDASLLLRQSFGLTLSHLQRADTQIQVFTALAGVKLKSRTNSPSNVSGQTM